MKISYGEFWPKARGELLACPFKWLYGRGTRIGDVDQALAFEDIKQP